jgi:hypothetical protein
MIDKIQIKETKYCATETKLKTGGGLGSAGKIRSYYITSDIRSVIFAKYPEIIHQWESEGIVSTTNVISGADT